MGALDLASLALLVAAAAFFTAGTLGLLRFPDTASRLHALTKVDNLGLGLTVAALALQAERWTVAVELGLVWLLALAASATAGYLIARTLLDDDLR